MKSIGLRIDPWELPHSMINSSQSWRSCHIYPEKFQKKTKHIQFQFLSRVPTRELEPVNLRFCREKPAFTTCTRLRDDISEEGPLAKTPLCSVEVKRESVN